MFGSKARFKKWEMTQRILAGILNLSTSDRHPGAVAWFDMVKALKRPPTPNEIFELAGAAQRLLPVPIWAVIGDVLHLYHL